MVPVLEHRTLTESSMPVENTNVALAGAAFHHEQICTGRVAPMRPFLIPAPATGIRSHLQSGCDGLPQAAVCLHIQPMASIISMYVTLMAR